MSDADFIDVCAEGDLPPGARRLIHLPDVDVAVFNIGGQLYAFDNSCPHRGGPLCEGDLDGHVLYCPQHAWPFDVRTGVCVAFPEAKVRTFAVRVHEGRIQFAREGRFA